MITINTELTLGVRNIGAPMPPRSQQPPVTTQSGPLFKGFDFVLQRRQPWLKHIHICSTHQRLSSATAGIFYSISAKPLLLQCRCDPTFFMLADIVPQWTLCLAEIWSSWSKFSLLPVPSACICTHNELNKLFIFPTDAIFFFVVALWRMCGCL